MEELEIYQPAEKLQFRIEDDARATWAMKQLREKVRKIQENEAIAKQEREAIDSWLEAVNGSLASDADYFRGLLVDYMRRERENRKSIKLPWGTLKSQKAPDKVELDDEFTEWAKVNAKDLLVFPEAPPPKPVLSAVKKALEAGKPIEHAKIVEGVVSYSVEVK